jgi:hypothetical protein
MSIENIKVFRYLLFSLYKMQRKHGAVTGTVFWFAAMCVICFIIVYSIFRIIL